MALSTPVEFLNYPEKGLYMKKVDRNGDIWNFQIVMRGNEYDGDVFATLDDSDATSQNLVTHVTIGDVAKDFFGSNRTSEAKAFIQTEWERVREEQFPSSIRIVDNGLYVGNVLMAWATTDNGGKLIFRMSQYHYAKFFDMDENAHKRGFFGSAEEAMQYAMAHVDIARYEQEKKVAGKAKMENLKETATFLGMKALSGTDKQKQWAEKIRTDFLKNATAEEAKAAKRRTSSKFWIDNRANLSGALK